MTKLHITDHFRWISSQRASNAKSFAVTWRHHVKTSLHYNDAIMGTVASQIISLTIVYSTVYSDADQRKHQKLRVTGLCAGNSPGTGEFPGQIASNAEMFPFDDVIMFVEAKQAGPRINMKMLIYQYRKSQFGDKTVVWSSCLHNGISYTGKMASLYWISPKCQWLKTVRVLFPLKNTGDKVPVYRDPGAKQQLL